MDRLSGAYKRHVQRVAFVIGFVLVAATNADTLGLATRFWNDPISRQAQGAMAAKFPEQCAEDSSGKITCGGKLTTSMELPMKWTRAEWHGLAGIDLAWAIWLKVIGLLTSALAVSLGSPFWFDLLKRVAPGFAMSGRAPERQA